jgi:hypothetical protein
MSPAGVSQPGGFHMIAAVGDEEGKGREALQNCFASARTCEALQELLQHQPGRQHGLASLEGVSEPLHRRPSRKRIASERERPHARIDEQLQSRDRSAL